MSLQVIDTGANTPEKNMAKDMELLDSLSFQPECLLHFYEWDGPAATYGYFSQPKKFLSDEGVKKHSLTVAKRPTGGGIIFHQFDFAFSLLLSASHPEYSLNTLANYQFVNRIVARAIVDSMHLKTVPQLLEKEVCVCKEMPQKHFCMAKPTVYDLIIDGRKVAGAAQRRSKFGYLHQGSISLQMPSNDYLTDLLLPETGIAAAMQASSYPLLGSNQDSASLFEARNALKHTLTITLTNQLEAVT